MDASSSTTTEERLWTGGKGEPMPIRELPEAFNAVHVLGPAMILVALGVGLGETYLWPRLVILFGPNIRWLFLVGVTIQAFVMLEMARYAMATGESIFFGAARVWKPLMWFFFVVAIAVYIWPGHISAGADAFEQLTGIPWQVSAIVGMVIIGLVYTVAKVVYNIVENLLSVLVGILVIGSAVVAGLVGSLGDLGSTLQGLFMFGFIPKDMFTALWFPVIVGACAFAGPSGMQQMWYTLWLRDKGAGMGAHLPRIKGLLHAGEEETMPSRGYMFDTENPAEMTKWKAWRRWVAVDTWVLFYGITMLVTIIFTIIAQSAARLSPAVVTQMKADDQSAVLQAMYNAFAHGGGRAMGLLLYAFIALVGFKASFGLFDAFARGQADMTYFFVRGARKFKMSQLYFVFLWGVLIFGIIILLWGPADGPTQILNTLAFASTLVMGAYCVTLLFVNNKVLPKRIRPGWITKTVLGIGAVFYLGMLFYSLAAYGVVVG
jgi:hypothetical protein